MADDIIFRRAPFGGFNKEDVLSYIKDIKDETDKYERKAAELETMLEKAQSDRDAAQTAADETNIKLGEISAELEKKDEEIAQLTEKLGNFDSLAEEYAAAQREIERLTAQINKGVQDSDVQKDGIIAQLEITINSLRGEIAALSEENRMLKEREPLKDESAEVQSAVGNAIVDARRFSDTIISETESSIDALAQRARETADAAQAKITEINRSISEFAEKIGSVITAANCDTLELGGNINDFMEFFTQIKQKIGDYVSPLDKE